MLNPEEYGDQQPLIVSAIFQKTIKPKLRVDRLEGAYEKDPEFIDFVAACEAPAMKLLSAEQQLEEIEKAAVGKIRFEYIFIPEIYLLYLVTLTSTYVHNSAGRGTESCNESEK